jgi:hypothetical protein
VAWIDGDPARGRGLSGGGDWRLAATGDFDGDGVTDLVWRNTAGAHTVWIMAPGGGTTFEGVLGSGGWTVEATGDFDDDGRTDLVWRETATGINVMWLMDGAAVHTATAIGGDQAWRLAPAAVGFDANGDGRSDLVWTHAVSGVHVLWTMSGSTVTGSRVLGGDGNWQLVATGDFDGDGRGDLLWRHRDQGAVVLWLMADGSVRSSHVVGGDPAWTVVAAMDTDGDRRAELFWKHFGNGTVVRWSMDGPTVRSRAVLGGDAFWRLVGRGVARDGA